jgi:hypothetical protein
MMVTDVDDDNGNNNNNNNNLQIDAQFDIAKIAYNHAKNFAFVERLMCRPISLMTL